ncbi:MAG: hypothetical protein EXR69_08510 [Myxococcales bacterium]|nr:hypothetical protein [Myxococcales bacterium]
MAARFAFLVHPLVEPARRLMAVRTFQPAVALGLRRADPRRDVAELTRLSFAGVEGVVMGVPMLPEELLADQELALAAMERAVQEAGPVQFVGLGSVLSVVAGRGSALQAACGIPVTTGNAATAWAATAVVKEVVRRRAAASAGRRGGVGATGGGTGLPRALAGPIRRVAVLGGRGTVGKAVAGLLDEDLHGVDVVVDPQDVSSCGLVVGAHTTGGALDPKMYPEGVLVDVALPPTLTGRPLSRCTVYAGESVHLPAGWRRDRWGGVFHVVAGYGWNSVYACLIEPLVALAVNRAEPWAQGKRLDVAEVRAFGVAAVGIGLRPELAMRG